MLTDDLGLKNELLARWMADDTGHEILSNAGIQKLIADGLKYRDIQNAPRLLPPSSFLPFSGPAFVKAGFCQARRKSKPSKSNSHPRPATRPHALARKSGARKESRPLKKGTTMTLATSAFTTFSAIGNREDLSNRISRIDPTETPFYSGIEKSKASATKHEWQTQALAAASTSNAQLEGDDGYAADAATATVRLDNVCQISRKTPALPAPSRRLTTPAVATKWTIRSCSRAWN
jgi:hypothetical protein